MRECYLVPEESNSLNESVFKHTVEPIAYPISSQTKAGVRVRIPDRTCTRVLPKVMSTSYNDTKVYVQKKVSKI
jgi:hypothetical protein